MIKTDQHRISECTFCSVFSYWGLFHKWNEDIELEQNSCVHINKVELYWQVSLRVILCLHQRTSDIIPHCMWIYLVIILTVVIARQMLSPVFTHLSYDLTLTYLEDHTLQFCNCCQYLTRILFLFFFVFFYSLPIFCLVIVGPYFPHLCLHDKSTFWILLQFEVGVRQGDTLLP